MSSSTGTRPDPYAIVRSTGALVAGAVAVPAAMFAGSLAQLSHGGSGIGAFRPGSAFDAVHHASGNLDLTGVVLTAGATLPLVAWRRTPVGVFAVTATATVLLAGLGYPMDLALGPAMALYQLAATRDQHTPWTRHTTVTVVGLFLAYLAAVASSRGDLPEAALLHSGLAWAVAWFAGERTRLRREHIAELQERALRTERDAERERLLAAAEERARIARDLHDSAGHAISVIAVRAGAARLRHDQDPDRSRVALEAIEELARQTAGEIDQIVRTLRQGAPERPDEPNGSANRDVEAPTGLAALDTLVARHAAAGLAITVDAPPGLDAARVARTLGGPADQAAYRILQESLTNAARHGTGSARVVLAHGDSAIELTITNPVAAESASRPSGGHGLIGMRERAALLGGSFDAERVNGTFRVHATIPHGGLRP